jgi:hypothetical protein
MQLPENKTTTWRPIETVDPAREATLKRAYLLCQRRKYDEAERLLKMVLGTAPNDPDARYLLGRIQSTARLEKAENEGLRSWRYRLGLQSSWARFCAYAGSLIGLCYGAWNVWQALVDGSAKGFGAEITTMVARGGGRYGPRYYVPWTRPVYFDLIYGLAFVAVALIVGVVVYRVSRGAAMWEEIGNPGETGW